MKQSFKVESLFWGDSKALQEFTSVMVSGPRTIFCTTPCFPVEQKALVQHSEEFMSGRYFLQIPGSVLLVFLALQLDSQQSQKLL